MSRKPIFIPKRVEESLREAPVEFQMELRMHLNNITTLLDEKGFSFMAGGIPQDPNTERFIWNHRDGKAYFSVDPTNNVIFLHGIELESVAKAAL